MFEKFLDVLNFLGGYIAEYWWALALFGFGIWLGLKIWKKAEEYAAGRMAGVIHLVLTVLFFAALSGLALGLIWYAGWFPLKAFVAANNTIIEIREEWGALPPIGTPMVVPTQGGPSPTQANTPNPTQPACPQIPTGPHTVIWDPTASLHSGPLGTTPIIAEIPKGQTVMVLETSCIDDYDIGGETRRVRVIWNNGSEIEGWLHVATIQH
jgi:hypothetical protein